MRKKLLTTYITIIAITIIVTVLLSWKKVNIRFYTQIENEAVKQVNLLNEILVYELKSGNSPIEKTLQNFAQEYEKKTELRITIIDTKGEVIADSLSRPKEMENHKYRAEFKAALAGKTESAIRYSNTLNINYFYYAEPLDLEEFQGALRVSLPVNEIKTVQWEWLSAIILALIVGIVLSIITAYLFTRKFMKPIEELTNTAKVIANGDLDNKVYVDNNDEVGQLAKAFNTMTFTMRKNLLDIEHKNAELESILTSIDFGLAAIDLSYRVILHNEPFEKILNLEKDIDGKYFYEAIRNTVMIKVIESSIDDEEFISEETVIRVGGEERIIRISSSPIKSDTEEYTLHGMLLVVEDITQIRKLENIRQEFVSNVTHELKTPLTSIRGFVDTLKNGAINEEDVALRFLDIIDIESERLTLLIEDILVLSEIESLDMDKNMDYYSISTIVSEVVNVLEPKAIEKKLVINVEIENDLKDFYCSKNRIKQLLINLVDNSLKYTEKGFINIICKLYKEEDMLYIEIKDTGIGMSKVHFDRLFERFYRVDKGRARKMGGTGLGLSIVKHIVELYSGEINVESEVGKGTFIVVKMPFSK